MTKKTCLVAFGRMTGAWPLAGQEMDYVNHGIDLAAGAT